MTEALIAIAISVALLIGCVPGAVLAYAFGVLFCALAWTGVVTAFSVIGRVVRS